MSAPRPPAPPSPRGRTRCTSVETGREGMAQLLERNKEWADEMRAKDPNFFLKLTDQQSPEILWIGCSDSRVPANEILKLPPGEVFVHRNIANQVLSTDMNCLSVLEYAVKFLKVKHIIVCGHYGCGGVNAALSQKEFGLVDNWIRSIKDLYIENAHKFHECDESTKLDLLIEENVASAVYNICHTRIVQNAWEEGQPVSVHGWCYRLTDGIIRDLNICVTGPDQVEGIYRRILDKAAPEH
ncbi:carbonic anhydrase [Achlya hypogyna]|uniref:Carbonic anhydrase n=1 Tax=Achlya hypogyna TaxID=1202772 RepID=A0A1V9ZTI4_ACHHY|nr:carbonic anhydrase [Achlya hypogyna]